MKLNGDPENIEMQCDKKRDKRSCTCNVPHQGNQPCPWHSLAHQTLICFSLFSSYLLLHHTDNYFTRKQWNVSQAYTTSDGREILETRLTYTSQQAGVATPGGKLGRGALSTSATNARASGIEEMLSAKNVKKFTVANFIGCGFMVQCPVESVWSIIKLK